MYIDELDDIINEYNNTYHRTIKIKHVDVKDNTYIDLMKEVNDKDRKFQVGDHVRILKYKKIFAKGYTWNMLVWRNFVIKKVKNTVPWTYIINDLNGEKFIETFMKKNCKKKNKKKEFRIEKYLRKKELSCKSNGKVLIIHLIAGLIKNTWTFWWRH